ncbi:hypothetical protein [Tahibacter amnicola]|uniref:Uncharacterized protein n=1 Tax=Tahibacter amnicola TaxID=2976241 RepID=A0ABY6BM35_9GAMM|nr:hypothetical protein [Tahibacter amnicola]UXI70115.1 hypothetical protein N4264_10940 [Tahibacter amnicola]
MRLVNCHSSLVLLAAAVGVNVHAADRVVYDEQLQNNFTNISWGGTENFANTTPAHAGTRSIRFLPRDWNGLSVVTTDALDTTTYRGLRFWVHGGSAGGQRVRLFVGNRVGSSTDIRAQADVAPMAGGTIAANAWTQVEVSFDSGAMAFSGTFNNVYLMDWGVDGSEQTPLYLDDVVLLERAPTGGPDPIFSGNFEPVIAPPDNGIVIEPDVNLDGFRSDRYTWRDSAGRPRSAAMVRNTQRDPASKYGGYLRQLTYQLADQSTRTVTGSFNGHPGFGYVVSHFGNGLGSWGVAGYDTPGQFRTLFAGRHHAIHRYTQTFQFAGMNGSGGVSQYPVGITIDWTFVTGRDHPLWSISYDMSSAPVNALEGDSRSPYGDMTFDGAAPGTGDTVMGAAWGERYKFTTTAGPLTLNSPWAWTAPNTVPYANLWTQNVDAEMGMVQTQTITQQDAGGYWGYARWGSTSAAGPACTSGTTSTMPCTWNWPYQLNQYSFLGTDDSTISKRIAWGTNYGFLGKASYPELGDTGMRAGWPRQSYNLHIVLDRHSISPTLSQVQQVETVQNVTLTATQGQVLTQGPAGAGRTDTKPYQPAGYNHVYGTWEVQAAGNAVNLGVQVGSGTLNRPVLVVRGYTGSALPGTVRLNGMTLVRDVDYFPSLDDAGDALWITLNRNLSGNSTLIVSP